jgi:hypothetical protein
VSCIIQANKQTKEYCPSFLPGASIFNAPLLQRNTARERENSAAFPLFRRLTLQEPLLPSPLAHNPFISAGKKTANGIDFCN